MMTIYIQVHGVDEEVKSGGEKNRDVKEQETSLRMNRFSRKGTEGRKVRSYSKFHLRLCLFCSPLFIVNNIYCLNNWSKNKILGFKFACYNKIQGMIIDMSC